eukprot:TRINITY_DN6619_c0_g1_i1.p1 TRINITY_DN6619_c0_g1~~TRINITY_DN6619_c0_g1_i1.p1  ORF type:complete len:73 (-),score=10.57 TRINITY_DN6619_c0_g1_i1:51-269(-)
MPDNPIVKNQFPDLVDGKSQESSLDQAGSVVNAGKQEVSPRKNESTPNSSPVRDSRGLKKRFFSDTNYTQSG